MEKKIIKISEEKLAEIIKDIAMQNLNEMDGATYSRIYNASHRARSDNQNGQMQHKVGMKVVNNDDIINRAINLQPKVQNHWLNDFIGKTFKFYGEDRMGLVANVLFTFEKITKLDLNKTILVGTILFNTNQINGDGIIIDFVKNNVVYHERGTRYIYNLEIDNRTKKNWNDLLFQLKLSLESRK